MKLQFQSNWNLIWQTRQLIYQSLKSVAGANPRVLYDLRGGVWWHVGHLNHMVRRIPVYLQYVTTLWSVYTYNYGVSDTIGFSIVPGFSGQISAQISAYDSTTGGRPKAYGFDLYGNPASVAAGDYSSFDTQLDFISSELGAAGELSKELFVQETYFNSTLARNALSQATQKGISFRYLFQWPYRAGTRPASWMFTTSVRIFPTHRAASPTIIFLTGTSFIKITFITPMVSLLQVQQLLDPIRGIPSRGFPRT